MVRTGIPVSVWEGEDPAVMATAVRILNRDDSEAAAPSAGVLIAGGNRG